MLRMFEQPVGEQVLFRGIDADELIVEPYRKR